MSASDSDLDVQRAGELRAVAAGTEARQQHHPGRRMGALSPQPATTDRR